MISVDLYKSLGYNVNMLDIKEKVEKDYIVEYKFLKDNYNQMLRTMLRYSIEKVNKNTYQKFLKGEI